MLNHKLPSGSILSVTPLSFEEAWAVSQVVTKVIGEIKVNLKDVDLSKLMMNDVFELKGPICAVLASEEVIKAARKCLEKCTYNGPRVDQSTFEKVESRKDFLPACFYALKENVYPFFDGIASVLSSPN